MPSGPDKSTCLLLMFVQCRRLLNNTPDGILQQFFLIGIQAYLGHRLFVGKFDSINLEGRQALQVTRNRFCIAEIEVKIAVAIHSASVMERKLNPRTVKTHDSRRCIVKTEAASTAA